MLCKLFFTFQAHFQGFCQLIRAGGALAVAVDATQLLDHIFCRLPLYQCGDTLQVAVAATKEFYIVYLALLVQIKGDLPGAGTVGIISVAHLDSPVF